jgi:hypothetical protein
VVVEVVVTWAEAARVHTVINETVIARFKQFMIRSLISACGDRRLSF